MIYFKTLKWRNFLSTGNNFTEVRLDQHKTSLIVGENGAGKSTILDALTFALFGKPFRNINKPAIVNSVNKKGPQPFGWGPFRNLTTLDYLPESKFSPSALPMLPSQP